MVPHKLKVAIFHCKKDVWLALYTVANALVKVRTELHSNLTHEVLRGKGEVCSDREMIRRDAFDGEFDSAAAERNSVPENRPAFAAIRVKHAAASHDTACEPLHPHLYFSHANPRYTLHHALGPTPCCTVCHTHVSRRGGQARACGCHQAKHEAQRDTW